MKTNRKPLRRMLDRAQKSFVRSRPGSVLILVIALLVLMALIGTAFMSMAQNDRTTSVQHSNNTEIDMLMDGMANIVKGAITGDLYNQGKYRPATSLLTAAPATFQNYNTVGAASAFQNYNGLGVDVAHYLFLNLSYNTNPGNPYLAARAPELFNEIGSAVPNPGVVSAGNPPTWSYVTAPLIGGQFSSPIPASGLPFLDGQTPAFPNYYTQRSSRYEGYPPLVPGFLTYQQPGSSNSKNLPAWVNTSTGATILAADADGDGIADSGLIKLPIGSINGVTYYAAFRIIDSSSAINVNTAWQHNPQTAIGSTVAGATSGIGSMPGDFFPSSIDLASMACNADYGLASLLNTRFNKLPPTGPAQALSAIDDNGNPRTDLPSSAFNNALESSWLQFGRRINFPGYVASGTLFQAYSRTDGLGLLHDFVVRNPTLNASTLESDLQNSLYNNANLATSPYDASSALTLNLALNWYNNNFSFLANEFGAPPPTPNPVPLRALLTTENAVSNQAPNTFSDQGAWSPTTTYQFGDSVTYTDAASTSLHRYVCINPANTNAAVPPTVHPGPYLSLPTPSPTGTPGQSQTAYLDNDTWVAMPWMDTPTKISANTGTFGQLYLAYLSVMANQSLDSNGHVINTAPFPYPANPTGVNARMFRSPLRIPPSQTATAPTAPVFRLSPSQVMQLRAAIAAVNTIDMRDNDDDVTSRQVLLTPAPGESSSYAAVYATVYGQEPQPFITEVYATNAKVAPAVGYVAIKLFNPYSVPLDLSNYHLGMISRSSSSPPIASDLNHTITEIVPDNPLTFWAPGTAPVIPANSFILIASQAGPYGTVAMPPSIKPVLLPADVPAPGSGLFAEYIMSNLQMALNNEIVLLRPRRGSNALYGEGGVNAGRLTTITGTATTHLPTGDFAESAATLYDMVPVDSYDLGGLTPLTTDSPVEWHYLRPSDDETAITEEPTSWHWVYPGHYRFSSITTPPPPNLAVEDVTGSNSLPPRLVDGTHRGLFPGKSYTASGPTVLTNPTGRNPLEIWTMGQNGFNPNVTPYLDANLYCDIPLRLNSPDAAGPNNPLHTQRTAAQPRENNSFPHGGFARNGDILSVPFIGSYTLSLTPSRATFLEMNPVTMDSVMALATAQVNWKETAADTETTTGNCDPLTRAGTVPRVTYENVGRFTPLTLLPTELPASTSVDPTISDVSNNQLSWRYHFGTKLFDFLTVQSPQQDYFPDVDPAAVDPSTPPNATLPYKYPGTSSPLVPLPVANSIKSVYNSELINSPLGATEQAIGVQGLVNINTAPWRVLAAVPWLPPSVTNANNNGPRNDNAQIAMSIVYYRDILDPVTNKPHGPFKSLFELNNVPMVSEPPLSAITGGTLFKNILRDIAPYNTYSDLQRGNLTAAYQNTNAAIANTDLTQGDYVSQNLMMTRASNLVTTHSDQFIAYILLQGWTNAETTNAQLVVQRRAAYLIDRTGVIGTANASPSMTFVPNN